MRVFSDFFKGIDYFFKGLSFLFSKGLWYYMLYPFLLWIAMFTATLFLVGDLVDSIVKWLEEYLKSVITEGIAYLSFVKIASLIKAITFVTGIILRLAFWFIGGTLVKYLTLILLSPVLSRLSEVMESKVSGKKFEISFVQFLKDIARGISITLRNMFFEYLFIISGFVICFIFPPAVFVVTPVLFFISCYYYGFTMMDYSCERNRMTIREGIVFMKKHKALVCGTGCCLLLILKIPTLFGDLIGLTVGPAAACIGATLAFYNIKKEESAEV
ncbi:MAG TPA: EI24 domain-containing protein [Bacteroidia bacterium]|jgi:CysZ protein|nr:EI24 domain-containing protein [Bacteroidia bacterium]